MGVLRGLGVLMLVLASTLVVEGVKLPDALYVDVDCHINDPDDATHNGLKIEVNLLDLATQEIADGNLQTGDTYQGTPFLVVQAVPTAAPKCIGNANEAVTNVFELFPYTAGNDIPQCDGVELDADPTKFKVTVYIPYRANLRLIKDKQVTFTCKPSKSIIEMEESTIHDGTQSLAEVTSGGDSGSGPAVVSLSVVNTDGEAATDVPLGTGLLLRAMADIGDADESYWTAMKITECRFESVDDSAMVINAVDANGCLDANAEPSVVDITFDQTAIDQSGNRPDLVVDLGFTAFLFPGGGAIDAKCKITVCSSGLEDCNVDCNSLRRRRRRDVTPANNTVVVSVSFTVGNGRGVSSVKTPSCEQTNDQQMDGVCFTMETTLALGIVALIVLLLIVIIIVVVIMRLKSVGPWREEKKMP